MKKRTGKEPSWRPYTIAACAAVLLYALLTNLQGVWSAVSGFIGFFEPVILGCVIAYVINAFSRIISRSIFKQIPSERRRTVLSNLLAFLGVLVLLVLAVMVLIPQLIESIEVFVRNLDGYVASVSAMLESWGISKSTIDLNSLISSSEDLLQDLLGYIQTNFSSILDAAADVGMGLVQWVIGLVLSIYLLADKDRIRAAAARLLKVLCGRKHYPGTRKLLFRCDEIFNRYIVYSLLDSIAVGILTALFMTVAGMEYAGLVAFVVGIANLVPTFGPVVGAVIGAFVLFLVHPVDALIFLVFTVLLQAVDGYILKPKLCGKSLGVSALMILIAVIVGGNMFGVIGILLGAPVVAILDDLYHDFFLPWLERKRRAADAEAPAEAVEPEKETKPPARH